MSARPGQDRASKLSNLFNAVLHGKRQIQGTNDASLFLEAAVSQADSTTPTAVIEELVNSKAGLSGIQAAVRKSFKLDFITTSIAPFLKILQDPQIQFLADGIFLAKILGAILIPRSLWTELVNLHRDGELQDAGLQAFAWLCVEVVSSESAALSGHQEDVKAIMQGPSLLEAESHEVRVFGYRLQKILGARAGAVAAAAAAAQGEHGPGGRHDNDLVDFRAINIYPTNDELLSKEKPFLQRLDDVFDTSAAPPEGRTSAYLGWLFRLLREDMMHELREDLQVATGKVKGRKTPLSFGLLRVVEGEESGPRFRPHTIILECKRGMENLGRMTAHKRNEFLASPTAVFKHGSIGALCLGDTFIGLGSMVKDRQALQEGKPVFGLQMTDGASLTRALAVLCGPKCNELVLYVVNTPTFAYEPVLKRLAQVKELPLDSHIIELNAEGELEQPERMQTRLRLMTEAWESNSKIDFKHYMETKQPLVLGGAQLKSMINGLKNPLALIQGPPGTGKSFIGAFIALQILQLTDRRILVLSYTNHALDQFLHDLVKIGVDASSMVRLGSKSSPETESLKLDTRLKDSKFRITGATWSTIAALKNELTDLRYQLIHLHGQLLQSSVSANDILDLLEFSEDESSFWQAFQVPVSDGDASFTHVLPNKKPATPQGLFHHWKRGSKYPLDPSMQSDEDRAAWMLPLKERKMLDEKWCRQVREEKIAQYVSVSEAAKVLQNQIDRLYDEEKRNLLSKMRVIGCTTTGAAMYQSIISTAAPEVVLVEEAGEILEAHVVAALSPSVKQLIQIGDHKQLRPKVNNYSLTVEKGDGYDLNVSMFERLIRQGHPYTALQEQHRSHPDISHYSRLLAYEHLEDAPKTLSKESIRGLQARVIFAHHERPEDDVQSIADRGDQGATRSKRNRFEAQMVLKTVRYLAQQGYNTKNLVVLTPYLGQLSLLRELLSGENDPVLNDLDAHDLIRAGLMNKASTQVKKQQLRLSTIDNYQGEESDIVIASLTRSNDSGDIGFMSARQRLVVLMSRARNGIILFGNMHTFLKSKKGHALWDELFSALKKKEALFDGLPVRCEQHPDQLQVLSQPEDFELHCPDGGCAQNCGQKLSCGKHVCPRKCHRLQNHSQIPCTQQLDKVCERGHKYKVPCSNEARACRTCAHEDAENRRRIARDLGLERERQERQARYAKEVQDLDDEIAHQKRLMKYNNEEQEQAKEVEEKRARLQSLRQTRARTEDAKAQKSKSEASQAAAKKGNSDGQPSGSSKQTTESASSGAKAEWELEKSQGARNSALDKLMDLIGLEAIKDEFLSVHESVTSSLRQGLSLSEDRFSCSLLGNPGTGKTTVARIWGEFLTLTGALPGSVFKETTGSKLASQGVPGCEKMIEDIKDDGGGVLFIDEAYQLSSGNSPGGKAVLDFLLAEVENLRGKVVFVLAGYDKEMESFFSHNPGLPSRFPITFKFADYTDEELLKIFQRQIDKKFQGKMQLEGGPGGLYARIVARRIGRGRGKPGFGNARAVENTIDTIRKRRVKNARQAKKTGAATDETRFNRCDLIGPEPKAALNGCPAWEKLNQMIGLAKVKEELGAFRDTVITNYQRELDEEPLIDFSLNRVFLGPPGTGKTTVAKLYGEILAHLGLLSNGEVVVKNPSDFVGSALGQSEAQTKGILASSVGKVLVIDEAYGLYGGEGVSDPYKAAVIDTIVAEVQSVPGDDRCVLLLGYDEDMKRMFQRVNPGLSRRFPISSAFVFEDFDDDALSKILDLKLTQAGFKASGQARTAALDVLGRARNRPNFGNAGEIDILLGRAKASHQKRLSAQKAKRGVLDVFDFDSDFDRATRDTDVKALFHGDVGREKVIELLEGLQNRVRELKSVDIDPKEEIPFSFLFRGPPGTGKTTTARKMGKVYYDMGFLANAEVIECSASDMIAQYVGQTGPKVRELMDKALGKVLFIDEAYRLSEGHFAKEAIDELVDCVTKPKYQGRLIIILAGYVGDINKLLSVNPGLSSRFPDTIDFEPLSSSECFQLLYTSLAGKKGDVERGGKRKLDISCLEKPLATFEQTVQGLFTQLATVEGWASGRDVKQIAKSVFRSIKLETPSPKLSKEAVIGELQRFLTERSNRAASSNTQDHGSIYTQPAMPQDPLAPAPPSLSIRTSTKMDEPTIEEPPSEPAAADDSPEGPAKRRFAAVVRDAGVSDEVWEQLEKDKAAQAKRDDDYHKLKESYQRASDEARERLVKILLEEEDKRRKEAEAQKKLAEIGVCPMGFAWIKQSGGYRCAGGAHFVGGDDLAALT